MINSTEILMSPRHKKNLDEIKAFLDEQEIDYSTEYDNFCLYYGNPNGKRSYEISYIACEEVPIAYKNYGIEGVEKDFFYKQSYKAEHEQNSFKCWVKDYEWEDPRKKEVLKSYWLYAAGKIKNKFYARDCEVREVPSKEAREFEANHCFYGKRGASLNLGLYLKKDKYGIPKDTLIMIYTFGKNFFGKNNDIEVLRVGTKKFCSVSGGASKLLKYFIRNYPYVKMGKQWIPVEKIKFYSDYDHNIGGSMEALGFDFVNYSEGGFMNLWLETGEVKGREPLKHKIIMEKMKEGKVLAIPNAGVKTFILDVKNKRDLYPLTDIGLKRKKDVEYELKGANTNCLF